MISGAGLNNETTVNIATNDNINPSRTDWWPMYHHDLSHSGYSTSRAPDTNLTLWTYVAGSSVDSSPAIAGGKVYSGSSDYNVYCLDAFTGVKIWQYSTGHPVFSSPAVSENMVYIGSTDSYGENGNAVYCLNASTGEKIWEFVEGSSEWGAYSSPAVADGKIYVGSGDHKVYCLDAFTGVKLWEFLTNGEIPSSPAVADGKVYIGSHDGFVYCLNASTGAELWSHVTSDMIMSSPAVVDGKVYIGSDEMYCLDAQTGVVIWQRQPSFYFSSPAVSNDKVYVCDIDGTVYCLNADNGLTLWQYAPGSGEVTYPAPVVADGKVYVGAHDGKVYCLNADTGEKIWDYLTGYYPMFSSPAVALGLVYIGDMTGNLYCFGEASQPPEAPVIYGPDHGSVNVTYTFYANCSSDDQSYVIWDWGDWNTSGWLGPYDSSQNISGSHMWTKPGVYKIKAKVRDVWGAGSPWSEPHNITIIDNKPPNTPTISGPNRVRKGVTYLYNAGATDADGDQLYYFFNWGDGTTSGWFGPYNTSTIIHTVHTWNETGTVIVKVKAKDIWGAESDWGTLPVRIFSLYDMPTLPFFKLFFERFPHAFPFLRYLLEPK